MKVGEKIIYSGEVKCEYVRSRNEINTVILLIIFFTLTEVTQTSVTGWPTLVV